VPAGGGTISIAQSAVTAMSASSMPIEIAVQPERAPEPTTKRDAVEPSLPVRPAGA